MTAAAANPCANFSSVPTIGQAAPNFWPALPAPPDPESRRVFTSSLETRIQSGLQVLILGILAWVGMTLVDLGKSSSRQEVVNAQVAKDIGALKDEVIVLRNQGTNAALTASQSATAAALAAANAASDAALAASKAAMAAAVTANDKDKSKDGRSR